jgi:pilus assembly protein CpaB
MDRRFLTVLGVSLVFALVVSSVFYQVSSKSGGRKVEGAELADVVIAARPLSAGLTVKAADLKVVKMPKSHYPKGAFSKVEDVIDRPVVSPVLLEEPILDGRLAPRGSGVGLAPIIPVGMRAVTVRVNDVVGVAGFVLPGMRVDVLITGEPPGTSRTRVTRTVLQNIVVLSAGQTLHTDAAGKPVNASTVTLLVSLQDAETLTLAGNEGRIQLVLRNGGDQNIEKTPGVNLAALYGPHVKPETPPESRPAEPRPRPKPEVRTVIAQAPAPPPPPQRPAESEIVVIRGVEKRTESVISKQSDNFGRNP